MKRFLIFAALVLSVGRVAADEGMWLLPSLEGIEKQMKARGLKLSAEDIYSATGGSLKDAIVQFGNGCTGEIVSPEGLIFTNHHCGYSSIQALSSVEHDYLKYGFWAQDRAQELPAAGLTVTFVRHIEEVTAEVLEGVKADDTEEARRKTVNDNIAEYIKEAGKRHAAGTTVMVRPMMGGNQYFAFATQTYSDVRLVGAPPSSIGKFGGETDNWMWPRHTGDFAVFRVYAAPDGVTPAMYASENVPYKTPTHLKISLKGYKEGDFSMIMGFPGSTQRFMTTYEIDQLLDHTNPNQIYIRGVRQEVLKKFMNASDEIRIKYANKYAGSSNYWKNAIGKSNGIVKLDVKGQKQAIQERFSQWAAGHPEYNDALPMIADAIAERTPLQSRMQIINETMLRSTDIIVAASMAGDMAKEGFDRGRVKALYKDYDETVDRAVATEMFRILIDSIPDALPDNFKHYADDIPALVEHLYDNSVFANGAKLTAWLDAGDLSSLDNDPAVQIRKHLVSISTRVPAANNAKYARGHRQFIAGLMQMEPSRKYYPDANLTIRFTYGQILPYSPADAAHYDHYTTLVGVMEKEDPRNPYEFFVPERLKELYAARDFGQYADKEGKIVTCFISNNDITGGNSGSPVLNARGELIGIAFDSNWEGVSGDIAFGKIQRTISVDARYVLFVIDKFAGAKHLIDEMSIVK